MNNLLPDVSWNWFFLLNGKGCPIVVESWKLWHPCCGGDFADLGALWWRIFEWLFGQAFEGSDSKGNHIILISITNIPWYPCFLLPVKLTPKTFIFPVIFLETSNGSKPNTAALFCENVSYPTWDSKHQDLSTGQGRRLGDEECAVLMQ